MRSPYLEVTFRHGQPLAAYLHLSRSPNDKSHHVVKANPGMIIDFTDTNRPIGIEITAPMQVTIADINQVLYDLSLPVLTDADVAPLKAA